MKKFQKLDADLFQKIEKTKMKKIIGGTNTPTVTYHKKSKTTTVGDDGVDNV